MMQQLRRKVVYPVLIYQRSFNCESL